MATTTQTPPLAGAPLELRARALALHEEGPSVQEVAKHLGITSTSIYNWRKSKRDAKGPVLPTYHLTSGDVAWLATLGHTVESTNGNGSQEDKMSEAGVVGEMASVQTDGVEDLHERIRGLEAELKETKADVIVARKACDEARNWADTLLQERDGLVEAHGAAVVALTAANKRAELWRDAARDALAHGK